MKGIVLEQRKNGVYVMDKNGCFSFVNGFTDCVTGDEIELPESLNKDTAGGKYLPFFTRRAVLVAACFVFLCFTSIFYALFINSAAYYVEIDAKADIELAINRLGMVISTEALNKEGAALLEQERFTGTFVNVMPDVITAIKEDGLHRTTGEDGVDFLEIVVISQNGEKAESICNDLKTRCRPYAPGLTDYGRCDMVTRENARKMDVAIGKLMIVERYLNIETSVSRDEAIDLPIETMYKVVLDKEVA